MWKLKQSKRRNSQILTSKSNSPLHLSQVYNSSIWCNIKWDLTLADLWDVKQTLQIGQFFKLPSECTTAVCSSRFLSILYPTLQCRHLNFFWDLCHFKWKCNSDILVNSLPHFKHLNFSMFVLGWMLFNDEISAALRISCFSINSSLDICPLTGNKLLLEALNNVDNNNFYLQRSHK